MKVLPAFVDETGVLTVPVQEQPVFGIGLLVVNDPGKVTDSFYKLHFDYLSDRTSERSRLRQEIMERAEQPTLEEIDALMGKSWHREYKFARVAGHNLQQYIELLNLYFDFECFEFHALLVDKTDPNFNLSRWGGDAWAAYVALGRELLDRRVTDPVFAITDFQGQPKKALVSVETEFCSVPKVAGCIRASSESEVFLKVVDVLLGCVQADWRDSNGLYPQSSNRSAARRRIVGYLKTRLGISVGEPIVTRQRDNWERPTGSPFTVSLYRWK